jgi:hypothetical protein
MCEKPAAGTDLLGLTAVFFLINVWKINLYVYTLFVAHLFCEKKNQLLPAARDSCGLLELIFFPFLLIWNVRMNVSYKYIYTHMKHLFVPSSSWCLNFFIFINMHTKVMCAHCWRVRVRQEFDVKSGYLLVEAEGMYTRIYAYFYITHTRIYAYYYIS